MRKITADELNEILCKHELWLNGNEEGERANLSEADLSEVDLRGANLSEADLTEANLTEANLSEANLYEAYLYESDLRGANLYKADLRGANLRGTVLRGANLRGTVLSEANLYEADLRGANLRGAKYIPYIPLACPEEGSFIGFKKAYTDWDCLRPVIVKLLVLEDAKRSSGTGRKCRCGKAKVLDIQDFDGNSIAVVAYSGYDRTFKYKIGEVVEVKDFDENRFNECAPGIHFFINRQDAVDY